MNPLASTLIILGLCLGAFGAAGFHQPYEPPPADVEGEPPADVEAAVEGADAKPTTEKFAPHLFGVGLILLLAGGWANKGFRGDEAAEQDLDKLEAMQAQLVEVRDRTRRLVEEGQSASDAEFCGELDSISKGPLFDLGSDAELLVTILGFQDYARLWDGIATSERLLSRAWSMTTDGHRAEGSAELPLALENLERSVAVMSELAVEET